MADPIWRIKDLKIQNFSK